MSEHTEQVALFAWAAMQSNLWPELGLLFAVPNGGLRHVRVAEKLKAEGVRRGVPDICLPVPRRQYHGLFIEMKFGKNKPTEEQAAWLQALLQMGYCTAVAYGWQYAARVLENYLEGSI
ncbi:MAG: VRR-NUC domain-containing protein [Anaerolineales bacterium]|nr:VRR-NUC domain-containing protein [Anaerolineales bacterium]